MLKRCGFLVLAILFFLAGCNTSEMVWKVAFLRPEGIGADVWILNQGTLWQVTKTGGKIYDFSLAPDGNSIVFSQHNTIGGLDLWQGYFDGRNANRLLDCGEDWCREPAFSPNGGLLAYRRDEYIRSPNAKAESRIWLLNSQNGETAPLYQEVFIPGEQPSWSPDGNRLFFFDGQARGLRIVDIDTGSSEFIPTDYAGADWSVDGKQIIFVELNYLSVDEIASGLFMVDVETQSINQIGLTPEKHIDYGIPELSPDGQYLLISWRYTSSPTGKQLKIIKLETGEELNISDDLTYHHAAYQWLPDNSGFVFQRSKLGSSQVQPEIWIWYRASGELVRIVENGALPQVVP